MQSNQILILALSIYTLCLCLHIKSVSKTDQLKLSWRASWSESQLGAHHIEGMLLQFVAHSLSFLKILYVVPYFMSSKMVHLSL